MLQGPAGSKLKPGSRGGSRSALPSGLDGQQCPIKQHVWRCAGAAFLVQQWYSLGLAVLRNGRLSITGDRVLRYMS
jgi:hypothetical protein